MSNQSNGGIGPSLCPSSLADAPLAQDEAVELARAFKALGDPARLRLLSVFAGHEGGEACVCEISGAFALTAQTISHHLKVLREVGLLDSDRRGTWVYYRVVPGVLRRLSLLLAGADLAGARA
jgi:ArsR family transcriptional regulator